MQPNRTRMSTFKWLLLLLAIAFGCIGTVLIAGDQMCHLNIGQWTPIYPGATVISQEHDFIRLRAMGTSTIILSSPDDPETVRQFYRDNTLRLLQEEKSQGLASTHWAVEPNPDGEGSIIILYSECGI